jgi:hypothetical protein
VDFRLIPRDELRSIISAREELACRRAFPDPCGSSAGPIELARAATQAQYRTRDERLSEEYWAAQE